MKNPLSKAHQKGERSRHDIAQIENKVAVDTYAGRVHIDWDHQAPVTPVV
jgi:hypothetical protein